GGVIPIITVLLGTTLAVMGATLLGTITTGTERAVWEANGSHVRVSGPRMTDPRVEELRGIDGVAAVARIYDAADNAKLELDGEEVWARLLLADPEIVDVYRPLPEGSPVPPSLFDEASVLLGGELADTAASATVPGLGSVPVVASLENLPGGSYGSAWVLADVTRWTQQAPTSNAALIAVDPGADIREVAERVALQVPNSRVTDVAAQLETLRDSQTVDGLTRAFLILAGATVALMALGVIGSQLLSGRERNHLAAVLRTFGLRPGQLRGLTAWEVGPAIVLALLVGVSLGIALAWLMLNGLDFTVLTGGEHVPQLHLHWPSLAVVLGALIATMALAVAVMSWLAGRTYVAQELRIGEQR
ncbi:MAG TPA: ABC transporter permease, partial [Propionibacterium sp.]|nr:ABC transporter permease [Propionibacterium sp.]